MMDCGNCGWWKFAEIKDKFALGVCQKVQGKFYLRTTPYSYVGDCWGPEGGKGPKARLSPIPVTDGSGNDLLSP